MTSLELQARFKSFSYSIVDLCSFLDKARISRIIEDQILRASFSAAANYRSACKAQSRKAFKSKLSIAFEEIDESLFLIEDPGFKNNNRS
jgi:four helix bundle protein